MMKMFRVSLEFVKRRCFLICWISLAVYLFYNTFIFYLNGRQFFYLRNILGIGLCISRGTATILNLCSALVLMPLCKKLNQILYYMMSKLLPGIFFYWLESAKSFHMTVAITLVLFAVIHSISHFVNIWNFSRGYDEEHPDINFATYKDESPFALLMTVTGLTGVSMLLITVGMALTSLRIVRRKFYNVFWYTHQLYLLFLVLFILHPLSGVLKEELIEEELFLVKIDNSTSDSTITGKPKFVSIKSKTWLWMAFPLFCFMLDLIWRILSRNRARVNILDVTYMAGRTLSVTVSCPGDRFICRMGQYVLLQCLDVSLLEWHPFTLVKLPTSSQNNFVIWIRVKGDWTENLERLLLQRGPDKLSILVDGPYSSPMEGARFSAVAICVAAGVGITPFVALLHHMLMNPRSNLPGRIHLIWIVRYEEEITWLADLASRTLTHLREANRPDRLHIELHVTNTRENSRDDVEKEMLAVVTNTGAVEYVTRKYSEDEKASLLTPNRRRNLDSKYDAASYRLAKDYPLLGCRLRPGRPHWDKIFEYWVHLYPKQNLNLYCCGPKTLVKLLRSKSKHISRTTKTRFAFVHEGFT